MNHLHNPNLSGNARRLRREMTKEERHLWYDFLKDLPVTVHRQKVLGPYIVDFYIAEKKVVIEIDGSQHFSDEHKQADEERDSVLSSWGIFVLRYTNHDVKYNFNAVAEDILNHIGLSFNDIKLL